MQYTESVQYTEICCERVLTSSSHMQEGRVDELEVQLQSTQADLKSAHKRIEQLHGALKDHEEFSGDDEDLQYTTSHVDSLDNLSSTGSSYSLDDGASLDFSDEDDDDDDVLVMKSSRGVNRKHSKDVSPIVNYKSKKAASKDLAEEEDEFEASRKARQRRLQQLEEEEQAASRRARQERLKSLEEDDPFEASRRARQERLKDLDNDDEYEVSRKARQRRLQDQDEDESSKKKSSLPSSSRHTKKAYDDEDDEDDDDLEEFLLKQRERMRKLADTDEEEEEPKSSTLRASRRGEDPVSNGKTNGVHSKKAGSREESEEPQGHKDSVEEGDSYAASRQRRKRQRRRTIEQLTSPEHQAAKANGVDL